MAEKTTFNVNPRTIKGKKVKNLRKQGITPANIVTEEGNSTMISANSKDFRHLYAKTGDTGVIYLKVGESAEEKPVMVEEVAVHPITGAFEHVVFRLVNLKEKLEAAIPVHIIGENKVPESVVVTVHNEIMVSALPTDLPEKFELDISGLTEIGQTITFADLVFDRGKVELVIEESLETPILILQEVKEEVEPEPEVVPVEGAEGAEAAAGATPAEGGEAGAATEGKEVDKPKAAEEK